MNRIQDIFKYLYRQYRIKYSRKEIKTIIVIIIFIYYMVDNKEKYNIELNSILDTDVIYLWLKNLKNFSIEREIIYPIEQNLSVNNYISNVYKNLKTKDDICFMRDLSETVSSLKYYSADELVEFINLEIEPMEIKEDKSLNYLIGEISPENVSTILDNFAGVGESIFANEENKKRYIQLQDSDEEKCAISTIILLMKQYNKFKVINTDTLNYREDRKFDLIVSVPPLVMNTSESKRDNWGSVKASFNSLSAYGECITLVNVGALTSSRNLDKTIRKELIKNKFIKAIIEFPEKMLHGTSIKTCLIMIDKKGSKDITLINLDNTYGEKYLERSSTGIVRITEKGIEEISSILNENKYSEISIKVEDNSLLDDFVLLPSLYLKNEEKHEYKDISTLLKEREILKERVHYSNKKYSKLLEDISNTFI